MLDCQTLKNQTVFLNSELCTYLAYLYQKCLFLWLFVSLSLLSEHAVAALVYDKLVLLWLNKKREASFTWFPWKGCNMNLVFIYLSQMVYKIGLTCRACKNIHVHTFETHFVSCCHCHDNYSMLISLCWGRLLRARHIIILMLTKSVSTTRRGYIIKYF